MGNFIQLPLYMGMFFAIRYMAFSPEAFESLHQVSFLYMERIVEADPYYLTPLLSAITTFLTIKYNRRLQSQNTGNQAIMMAKMMGYFQYVPFLAIFILGTYPAILNIYWWSVSFTNLMITLSTNSYLFKKAFGIHRYLPGSINYNKEFKENQRNLKHLMTVLHLK